jgi:23S rRNA (guanosine2251-2'-O)-methyltransferase
VTESDSYAGRKAFFDRVLTVYGRKPVLEALRDDQLTCHALHLADSNRSGGVVDQLTALAAQRGVPVRHHSRAELARISRNGRQDQGVALDILCPEFRSAADHSASLLELPPQRLLALDGVSNPQNLGMIVRSAVAGGIDGIIWTRRGNAALGPLVIKASAGTLYRAPMLLGADLVAILEQYRAGGTEVCTLSARARHSLFGYRPTGHCVYVLGNETEGVSPQVERIADRQLSIPMARGVESLNVAVTAGLIAYSSQMPYLDR